ncbi:hypothetical protein CLNEO_17050 [Anaerotignum neopropionicum]|uniref:Uncharacterized protein n=1 Tax=Anaerotignum neopropionicum TaxID=36847 RepID=A0A136WF32_9FIRM|nr:hypothetical protein [Anaerotignum neopropionicum]KXL53162.1 hypothetical protein CLNEO_17050 [Anaerotignum neopropionicum]
MRALEFSEGIQQFQEVRHSTHAIKRQQHGREQQFFDSGHGKTQNSDYEPLHYQDV